MKSYGIKIAAIAALALVLASSAHAQTAGVVNLAVTPASGTGSVTPTATWSTTPTASSCIASGGWTGNKAASGTQTLAAITSSTDYTLTCSWPGAAGTATVSWIAPTANSDGSPLTDLAAFKILFGPSATNLNQSATVSNPTASSAPIGSLTPGATYIFVVRAVNAKGVESANSTAAQKQIVGGSTPTASKTAAVTVDKVPGVPTGVTVVETTAFNIRADFQRFAFVRGPRWGTATKGAACDEDRCVAGGYCVVSSRRSLNPRPPEGDYKVAKCG